MIAFTNLSPAVFPLDQRTPLKCVNGDCNKQIMFCEAVIFNWHDGAKHNNAGFCTNVCALTCMTPPTMARA